VIERLAIVGVGLLGGSVAKAVRAQGLAREIVGVGRDLTRLEPARRDGTLDRVTTDLAAGIAGADRVVLAATVIANESLLVPVWRTAAPGAIVTDVGSTKRGIVAAAERLAPSRRDVAFVGSHPMAGSEKAGYAVARVDLFQNAIVVVTPTDTTAPATAKSIAEFWMAQGARVVTLDPATHDRAVAAISHLPLVVSAALVETVLGVDGEAPPPESGDAIGLAAGGWASMTRLARGDVAMATGIAATNRDALVGQLLAYRDRIDEWLALLDRPEPPDAQALERRFAGARERAREGRT
jgi:prephenate dehydrogenase